MLKLIVKLLITFYVFFVFLNGNAGAEDCGRLSPRNPNIPYCPEGRRLLDESYPVAAVMVSDTFGDFQWVNELVKSAVSQIDNPPRIIFSGNQINCDRLRRSLRIGQRIGSVNKRFDIQRDLICGPPNSAWQQDIVQKTFNAETGHPHILMNMNHRDLRENHDPSNPKHLYSQLKNICGFEVSRRSAGIDNIEGGGNVLSLPPDICLTGDAENRGVQDEEQRYQQLCLGQGEMISAPTHFLSVGHVDEIVQIVNTPDNSDCPFVVFVADSHLGMELLEGSDQIFETEGPVFEKIQENRRFARLCGRELHRRETKDNLRESTVFFKMFHNTLFPHTKDYKTLPALASNSLVISTPNAQETVQKEKLTQIRRRLEILKNRLPERSIEYLTIRLNQLEKDIQDGWNVLFHIEDLETFIIENRTLTSEEFKACLERDRFLTSFREEYGDTNRYIGAHLNQFAEMLSKRIINKNPGCKAPVQRLPTVYTTESKITPSRRGTIHIDGQRALPLFPEMTNSQSFDRRLLVSDPGVPSFKKYMENFARENSLKHSFINTIHGHNEHGNLHCLTNFIRYCRPRGE